VVIVIIDAAASLCVVAVVILETLFTFIYYSFVNDALKYHA
jgi:hypothetical protein